MTVELKEAVKIAKDFMADLYKGEAVSGIGLDEVVHDDSKHRWLVTVGFYRTDDGGTNLLNLHAPKYRHYKRVIVDDSDSAKARSVLAVENRAVAS